MVLDYGKILSRAWQIIWKNKVLWIFGILTSCGGNRSTNSPNLNVNYSVNSSDFGDIPPELMPQFDFFYRFIELNEDRLGWFVLAFILFVIILSFVFFLIGTYGQIGLVRGVRKAELEKPETLTFKAVASEIGPYFWRLVAFQLLILFALIALVVVITLIVALIGILTFGIGLLLFLPLICVLIPVVWAAMIILGQASIALVLEDLSISDALSRGWTVVRLNWAVYLVMGLILMVAGVVYSLIINVPYFAAMIPFYRAFLSADPLSSLENLFSNFFRSPAFWFMIAYWPVFIILQGLFITYSNSAWVLTFLEVTGKQDLGEDHTEPEPPALESELEPV